MRSSFATRPSIPFARLVTVLGAACFALTAASAKPKMGEAASENAGIIRATKSYVIKNTPITDASVKVEKVVGDFARVFVNTKMTDPAYAFLKRQKGSWKVLTLGTSFDPETYQSLGIPASLRVK